MTKMKLTARLTEAEAAIDNLNAKLNQVEKAKGKVAAEISEMTSSLDQAQVLNAAMDRKAKQFDKVIGEWKGKVDRLSYDLDVSQKETRNASSELFKVKSAYEETMLQLEEVRRITRLSPTRSRTSWIRSARVDAPSTRLTKSGSASRPRRWNCSPPWRRPRPPSSRRRTRC